jgi:hypothetical protein
MTPLASARLPLVMHLDRVENASSSKDLIQKATGFTSDVSFDFSRCLVR